MKIIGEKLNEKEMLAIKGGATCWCGWEGEETFGPFELLGQDPVLIVATAGGWCQLQGHSNGAAHCTGLPMT